MRIAIDEPSWRNKNVTLDQQEDIRKTSSHNAYHGVVKGIFHRTIKLLRQNFQLIFVFDGPSKPWKRGSRNAVCEETAHNIQLEKELFGLLNVPFRDAPGEAEAECAAMQKLGLVDAVWSEDADAFMFGATL
jgi:holliday junction resolvase YEN1